MLTSPAFGTRRNIPSMLLSEAFLSDSKDMLYTNGELRRTMKRKEEFPGTPALPDAVIRTDYYYKAVDHTGYFMALTQRDIVYRDATNNCWVFLNQTYTAGKITAAEETSGAQIALTIEGTGVDLEANITVGDFIQIDDNETKSTDVTWYEVLEVSGDVVTVSGTIPSGWEAGAGHDYLVRIQYSTGDADMWSSITYLDTWFCTNGVDKIQYWDGLETETQDLTECPYLAKRLYKYENRLIIGNLINIDTGVDYAFGFGWSGIDDYLDWGDESGSDSGMMQCEEGVGVITAFCDYLGFLYIFKENCVVKAWDVGGTLVFNKNLDIPEIGSNAPDSVIYTKDGIAFLANDNTFRLFNGINWDVISKAVEDMAGNINAENAWRTQGYWSKELERVIWIAPYLDSAALNKVFTYDCAVGSFHSGDMDDITSIGWYYQESGSPTYAELDDPPFVFETYADWNWPTYQFRQSLQKAPIIVCGDADGKVYRFYGAETDKGESYEAYGVLETDLTKGKQALNEYKRIYNVKVWCRSGKEGDELELEVRQGSEAIYRAAGTQSIAGDSEFVEVNFPVDYRGKHFGIKPIAGNKCDIVAMMFEYQWSGDR